MPTNHAGRGPHPRRTGTEHIGDHITGHGMQRLEHQATPPLPCPVIPRRLSEATEAAKASADEHRPVPAVRRKPRVHVRARRGDDSGTYGFRISCTLQRCTGGCTRGTLRRCTLRHGTLRSYARSSTRSTSVCIAGNKLLTSTSLDPCSGRRRQCSQPSVVNTRSCRSCRRQAACIALDSQAKAAGSCTRRTSGSKRLLPSRCYCSSSAATRQCRHTTVIGKITCSRQAVSISLNSGMLDVRCGLSCTSGPRMFSDRSCS